MSKEFKIISSPLHSLFRNIAGSAMHRHCEGAHSDRGNPEELIVAKACRVLADNQVEGKLAGIQGDTIRMCGLPRLLCSLAMTFSFYHCEIRRMAVVRRGVSTPKGSSLCRPIRAEVIIHKHYYAQILLFILLAMPTGCSCFPDKSQEIEKEREWNKKAVMVGKAMNQHQEALNKGLENIKKKFPGLDKTQLFQGNDVKDFLKNVYIPYLHAWKAYAEHHVKHETDRDARKNYEQGVYSSNLYLEKVPKWLQANNKDEMHRLIKNLIDKG